jgi:hypothetical protein
MYDILQSGRKFFFGAKCDVRVAQFRGPAIVGAAAMSRPGTIVDMRN